MPKCLKNCTIDSSFQNSLSRLKSCDCMVLRFCKEIVLCGYMYISSSDPLEEILYILHGIGFFYFQRKFSFKMFGACRIATLYDVMTRSKLLSLFVYGWLEGQIRKPDAAF